MTKASSADSAEKVAIAGGVGGLAPNTVAIAAVVGGLVVIAALVGICLALLRRSHKGTEVPRASADAETGQIQMNPI